MTPGGSVRPLGNGGSVSVGVGTGVRWPGGSDRVGDADAGPLGDGVGEGVADGLGHGSSVTMFQV